MYKIRKNGIGYLKPLNGRLVFSKYGKVWSQTGHLKNALRMRFGYSGSFKIFANCTLEILNPNDEGGYSLVEKSLFQFILEWMISEEKYLEDPSKNWRKIRDNREICRALTSEEFFDDLQNIPITLYRFVEVSDCTRYAFLSKYILEEQLKDEYHEDVESGNLFFYDGMDDSVDIGEDEEVKEIITNEEYLSRVKSSRNLNFLIYGGCCSSCV